MKYKKIYHTPKEPHFLNVLFPTILPFDWLLVAWYILTFRTVRAFFCIQNILVLIKLNKLAKVSFSDKYLADVYSTNSMSKSDRMSELFRFAALLNEAEKMEKDRAVIKK